MLVTVTAEHIAKGERGSCLWCPLALAIEDATGEPPFVICGYATSRKWRLELPASACIFYTRFDGGLPVQPFSFTLDIPEENHP